jgi:ribonuclease-3
MPHDYERLEFLGDAVLGLVVVDELYRRFPALSEGTLTKFKIRLVSGPTLSATAERLGMADLIMVGESERGAGTRGLRSALENAYEAVVGAVYLDGGLEAARRFVVETLGDRMTADSLDDLDLEHPKSRLQEIIQAQGRSVSYRISAQEGPAHARQFTAEVLIEGEVVGSGTGRTKRDAEAHAAREALARISVV